MGLLRVADEPQSQASSTLSSSDSPSRPFFPSLPRRLPRLRPALCGEISRIPVCRRCLKAPEPFSADYFCISCRTPFQNGFPLDSEGRCALCRSGLRGFDAAYCFGSYEGVLRELIHLYKYGRIPTLARPLADLLAAALPRDERVRRDCAGAAALAAQMAAGIQPVGIAGARAIAQRRAFRWCSALRRARSDRGAGGPEQSPRGGRM